MSELPLAFDRWLAATAERPPELSTRELGGAIRAVSRVYVEGRQAGGLGGRATASQGRRAAFARFYAPLHFLCVWHALGELRAALPAAAPTRLLDLGCGSGAAGAAAALRFAPPPRVEAIDALGWALGEARRTYACFGLGARVRRGELPKALPRLDAGDLVVCGWLLNELEAEPRETLLERLERGVRRGAAVLVLEPLAGSASPWWDAAAHRLRGAGLESGLFKTELELPEPLRTLDRSAGLDHRVLGARWLAGPA